MIVFDCDGVLLDWESGFALFVHEVHGIFVDPTGPSEWALHHWLGTSYRVAAQLVREFNSTVAFGELYAHSYRTAHNLNLLKRAGHKLAVVTSCHDSDEVQVRRADNLRHQFGDVFDSITCLQLGQSKLDSLVKLDGTAWVEDNYENAKLGLSLGYKAFMVKRQHNREHWGKTDVTWMTDTWHPLINL